MATTRILTSKGRKIEVTWDLQQRTTIPSGKKIWILKIKVCNKTKKDLDIAVAENPWRFPKNTEKMQYEKDANQKEIPGSDKKFARDGAKPLKLKPNECKTVEFTYDIRPGQAYTDIFERKPDGTLPPDWTWGTIERLTPIQVSLAPRNQRRVFALEFPIPYQMFADDITDEPISAVVSRIDIPEGFELVHAFPSVGAPVELERAERGSSASILLRQLDGLPEGDRVPVTMWQKIVRPAELSDQDPRPVTLELVNDRTPPRIQLRRAHVGKQALLLTADLSDTSSGIDTVEAIAFNDERLLMCVPPASLSTADDGVGLTAEFSIPFVRDASRIQYAVRAYDAVGNEAITPIPEVSSDPC